jgi:hypothetical protein
MDNKIKKNDSLLLLEIIVLENSKIIESKINTNSSKDI